MDDPIWDPPPAADPATTGTEASLAPDPIEPATSAAFAGRTPGRAPALRAGVLLGGVLVVAVATAAALGASPSSNPTAGTGAAPSADASGAPNPGQGNGRRPKGPFAFPGAGLPSIVGPFWGSGPGFGPGRDGSPRFGFGGVTVTAISGSDLSLKTEDGWTRTISVTSETKITKGGQPGSLADVKIGDVVRFAEKRNDDGTFTITALAIVVPETSGTVTAVGADTVTITGRDGTTQTVRTTGSTTYRIGGADGSRSDVTVGATIVAIGERGADGSITAATIQIVLPRVLGTVTAVGSDSITLRRPDGTNLIVHAGSGTSIAVAGASSAQLSDIKVGMIAVAEGRQRSDGSLDATAIRAGMGGRLRPDGSWPKAAPGAPSSPSTGNG